MIWLILVFQLFISKVIADSGSSIAEVNRFAQQFVDNKLAVDKGSLVQDVNGAGTCSMLAGCKILGGKKGCYGPSGTNVCEKCQYLGYVSPRNVMRADFYHFDLEIMRRCKEGNERRKCPNILFLNEMVEYMYLEGTEVATSPQGALYKPDGELRYDVPDMHFSRYYEFKFCSQKCYLVLRRACLETTLLPHLRQWCLTSLAWIKDDIDTLTGPASYILFLASKLNDYYNEVELADNRTMECIQRVNNTGTHFETVECVWPSPNPRAEFEEKAALVAAAASSVLIAGNWFRHGGWRIAKPFEDFGYAIQHSLWLAIFVGRLRITLQPLDKKYKAGKFVVSGTQTMCSDADVEIAENYEGSTGTVYATLCAMFKERKRNENFVFKHPYLRYRPEIHTRNSYGCVERTAGMIFIRPGDWVHIESQTSILGSELFPSGFLFYDQNNLTTIEVGRSHTTLYPPSIAVSLKHQATTICVDAKGNGPNDGGMFAKAGLMGIGGMCNWVPVW